ncbi:MAG TPA: hypothetical protein VE954_14280 [Oligoflexus sp.]|uniref:hypothetical protein n=1 Tax=Oligoflexus sp. TaxID=1971216 RepID=UPI002D594CFF|nr:hypothetical protein [Oligoflexus sp.]HYX34266.1 hypothetical protein [Oligoflexus sp.]
MLACLISSSAFSNPAQGLRLEISTTIDPRATEELEAIDQLKIHGTRDSTYVDPTWSLDQLAIAGKTYYRVKGTVNLAAELPGLMSSQQVCSFIMVAKNLGGKQTFEFALINAADKIVWGDKSSIAGQPISVAFDICRNYQQ